MICILNLRIPEIHLFYTFLANGLFISFIYLLLPSTSFPTDYQPWKRELFAKAQASRVLGLVVEGLYGRWNGSGGRKGLARAIDIVGAPRGRPSIGRQC